MYEEDHMIIFNIIFEGGTISVFLHAYMYMFVHFMHNFMMQSSNSTHEKSCM